MKSKLIGSNVAINKGVGVRNTVYDEVLGTDAPAKWSGGFLSYQSARPRSFVVSTNHHHGRHSIYFRVGVGTSSCQTPDSGLF